MASNRTYKGYYAGIDKDGQVARVHEYSEGGTIVLSKMNTEGIPYEHPVMRGRQAKGEMVTVFHMRDVEFVSVNSEGSELEKQALARLAEKVAKT